MDLCRVDNDRSGSRRNVVDVERRKVRVTERWRVFYFVVEFVRRRFRSVEKEGACDLGKIERHDWPNLEGTKKRGWGV